MRVLMISELYPPFIGGSEEYVRNLARGLVERGHDVAVATIAGADGASIEDDEGVAVHRLRSATSRLERLVPSGRPHLPPAPDPGVVMGLRRVVAAHRPDVVHAHNWMVDSFLPLKAGSGAGLVMTLHDYSLVCAKRSLLYRDRECSGPAPEKCLRCAGRHYGAARGPAITLANWAVNPLRTRLVDLFVPVSRAVAHASGLTAAGVDHEVVPNFINDDLSAAANSGHAALDAIPDRPFWLYAGALSRHKGVSVLLAAYAGLVEPPPLVIIGRSGPDAPAALPANVTLLTDLPHDAVMAAWQRATVGIVPSLFPDPCPTVVLEAMASGVPVVGSRSGGMTDLVVDTETGVLVEPGDAVALRAALARLAGDEPTRARMASAARARAPQFMASAIVPRIESIYERVAA